MRIFAGKKTSVMRIAIFGNTYQTSKSTGIQRILERLVSHGDEVLIERDFHTFAIQSHQISLKPDGLIDDEDFTADMALSLGGDGTLLKTAAWVGNKQIPIMGINMGRLGFLADVSREEAEEAIDAIHRGDYAVERHSTVEVNTIGGQAFRQPFALNDVAVLKRDNASMITIETSINGEKLVTYQADGLIVSTPTGSTAYSLSNGGPIVMPQADILCLTPVAPHSLNIRPIAIPADSEIMLTVRSRTHQYLVAVDGRSEQCHETTQLMIRKAAHEVLIVKRLGRSYVDTLREKMMWGQDVRGMKNEE